MQILNQSSSQTQEFKMKSITTTFIILLGLSVTHGITDPAEKVSTFVEDLKDGFDTVYKYEERFTYSHQKLRDVDSETYDVIVRKSVQNDPEKFLMRFENVHIVGKENEPSLKAALELPVIVAVQNDDLHFYTTEADTNKSLKWKYNVLKLILNDLNEKAKMFSRRPSDDSTMEVELEVNGGAYGRCKHKIAIKTTSTNVLIYSNTTRDQCTGSLHKELLEDFEKYGAADVHGESEANLIYDFDRTTNHFSKLVETVEGTLMTEVKTKYSRVTELKFDSFKEIHENIDVSQNSKLYQPLIKNAVNKNVQKTQ